MATSSKNLLPNLTLFSNKSTAQASNSDAKSNKVRKSKRYSSQFKVNQLNINLDTLKDLTTEEKLKMYYNAKQSITNPEEYARQIRIKEIQLLCQDLGVDYSLENEKYNFFIEMALTAKLPSGWSKELQKDGSIYYFNCKDGSYSYSHPCLNSFKYLMNNEYKKVARGFGNDRAVYKVDGQIASNEVYTNRLHNIFTGNILKDITLYKLSKYFTKGNRQDKVQKQEVTHQELKRIYKGTYGYDIGNLILKLKNMIPMKVVDIYKVMQALYLLNITKYEPYLVWIARLYICLPLPDGWERVENLNEDKDNPDIYENWFTKISINVRPCYSYIVKLIEAAKRNRELSEKMAKIWMINQDHIFEDGFYRIYVVENNRLFQSELQKKLSNISQGLQNLFKAGDKSKQIVKKQETEQLTDPFVEKVEKYLKNPDLQDMHILTICRQLQIDTDKIENAHLLFFIYNFVHKKTVVSHWSFRNPAADECYWINHEFKRISGEYPFLDELKIELDEHQSKLQFKVLYNKMKKLAPFKKILGTKTDQQTVQEIVKFRSQFTQRYTEVKNSYNIELYTYLRKKLDKKIENYEKQKKFVFEDEVFEDINNKPKLRHYIS